MPRFSSRARRIATLAGLAAAMLGGSSAVAVETVRFATFNVSLYGAKSGETLNRLKTGDDVRTRRLAEIIQRVRPDVLLLNEIDEEERGELVDLLRAKYLAVGQNASNSPDGPAAPIEFPYRFAAPTNTGVHSGLDFDGNGRVDATPGGADYAGDCWGYGVYPGQYAFAILSKYPIDEGAIRTFQKLKWRDMPGGLLPDNPATSEPADWYSKEAVAELRLSSKNHCDAPIVIGGRRIHILACHPTPPVFDGPEDRNGKRNHDELRLWADYIANTDSEGLKAEDGEGKAGSRDYLIDDEGRRGGLPAGESFVILGDLNGDPQDGEGSAGIRQILRSPAVLRYPAPTSPGAAEQAKRQGGANLHHHGDPAADTCDPADDPGPGNLRLDYVLPSADLAVEKSGVFWPLESDPLFALTAGAAEPASSDHRLVWADVVVDEPSDRGTIEP